MKPAIFAAISILIPALHAQEKLQTLSGPVRISVLAVGDPPQPKFRIVDDKRELIDTPASDYPPGSVFLREKNSKGERYTEVTLGLNTPTGTIVYQGETTLHLFRESGGSEKTAFAALPLPPVHSDLTILLTRDRNKNTWEEQPKAKFLDNDFVSFPPDSVRFVNLSAVPVRILAGTEKPFELAPGASRVIRLPRGEQKNLTYKMAAVVDGKIFPLVDTATSYTLDNRINLVAYNSDGDDRRQPVKVIRFFERPPEVATKKD